MYFYIYIINYFYMYYQYDRKFDIVRIMLLKWNRIYKFRIIKIRIQKIKVFILLLGKILSFYFILRLNYIINMTEK